MESGFFRLHPNDDGSLDSELCASVEHSRTDMRLNDGRCDRQGRFWAGSMVLNMGANADAGQMYRFEAGQRSPVEAQLSGFIVPNGLGFSPDGRTMYLSDSHPLVQQIWAFDYDIDSGTPSNRRLLVDMMPLPGRPDGAAVDADGCYWICANDAGLIHRFTPDGRLDCSLQVPVKNRPCVPLAAVASTPSSSPRSAPVTTTTRSPWPVACSPSHPASRAWLNLLSEDGSTPRTDLLHRFTG
nr:hypothetical protein GCM10020185_67930 [Pseudomonas brassicacearum subsp. brassicacearum]